MAFFPHVVRDEQSVLYQLCKQLRPARFDEAESVNKNATCSMSKFYIVFETLPALR